MKELLKLKEMMDKNVESVYSEGIYEPEKHDIKITMNGETVILRYTADFHDELERAVDTLIEEY